MADCTWEEMLLIQGTAAVVLAAVLCSSNEVQVSYHITDPKF